MGLVSELLGRKSVESPAAARTVDEVETALDRLRSAREKARQQLADAIAERERLLLSDGSEKAMGVADGLGDAARLALERCEKLEPLLVAELAELRTVAKRERWRGLRKRNDATAAELVGLLRQALDVRARLLVIHDEACSAGFQHEVRSAFIPPPLCSPNRLRAMRRSKAALAFSRI